MRRAEAWREAQPTKIPNNPAQPAILQTVQVGDGSVGMLFYGATGRAYDIEISDDLENWKTITTIKVAETSETFVDHDAIRSGRRMYRIRLQ